MRPLLPILLVFTFTCTACSNDPVLETALERVQPAPQATAQPDAEVIAAVDQALVAGQLEGAKWSNLGDVIADLRTVYADQADRLIWFEVAKPVVKRLPPKGGRFLND